MSHAQTLLKASVLFHRLGLFYIWEATRPGVKGMAPLNAMTNLQEQSHAQTLLPALALLDWLCAWLLEEGPTKSSVREKAPL